MKNIIFVVIIILSVLIHIAQVKYENYSIFKIRENREIKIQLPKRLR